ncbi:MCE family protein [Nostocoides sp. Soil756]|jgi:virulence factor Mce-like protein|uniref:MCE family protein n=1 Tax=Nostocoides sp. Soil756 TaxID=1736399 RepID=UPI0006F7AC0E|nr:MCE family protein [Tetrasphaera sp. Soil756]KRE61047.1 mammalian cell entry protein [Tetrasphaera sp. Soil756]
MTGGFLAGLRSRSYGIAFLLVVAVLLTLSIAAFNKVFTDVVTVTLKTDRIGSQLQESSDVKIRGLIVGEVRGIEAGPQGATLTLALDPARTALIPASVSARLLPKTLFGERYVDLVTPPGDPGRPIREGDVIPQDRSSVAIELERVFDELLPLLRTVKPEKLAATLNALATALDGRGYRLGQNLVLVNRYFTELNPRMPLIQADISGLADLASTYAVAAPNLLRALDALRTTNATIVEKKDQLAGFLAGTAGFANTTAEFLEQNDDRIIQVGRVQRPTLAVLAKHAPVYPCLAAGLVNWLPRIRGAFSGAQFHITLETPPQRQGYRPGQEPAWNDDRGPTCYDLPNPRGSQANPREAVTFADGTGGGSGSALPSALLAPTGLAVPSVDSGLAGTVAEQQVVAIALAPEGGGEPSALTTLLAGPLLRGKVVNQ